MIKPYYWLTEESKLFLDRGYLLPNQTAEQRIEEIANKASEILNSNYVDDINVADIEQTTDLSSKSDKSLSADKPKISPIFSLATERSAKEMVGSSKNQEQSPNLPSIFSSATNNQQSVKPTNPQKPLKIAEFRDKFLEYMSKGYYSLSTPIWANFGLSRGLPISCFGSYIGDSVKDIMSTTAEVGMMSKVGGGTSAYFGDIRPRGSEISNNGKSDGSFTFTKLFETVIDTISQGSSRRGMFAGYIPIDHKDIEEWLNIHTEGNPIQLMFYGVTVTNKWLQEMKEGDVEKRKIWAKVLQRRSETGIPYIFFTDNVNNNKPECYKDDVIHCSNLCAEIALPSTIDESFVCCLSSMNLLHYDEWKDTDAVEVLTYFLDAVMAEFIEKGKNIPYLEKAVKFAKNHRAIGIGVLGWHSYLQSKKIPFESIQAISLNKLIFKNIKEKALKASKDLASWFGECAKTKGTGRRNTTLLAIAPTKSSSFILGQVSPSIEPYKSNYYVRDLAKIKVTFKNPYLLSLLQEKEKDNDEIWQSILVNNGSVQHLDFLSQEEKDVFKTFSEISQGIVIKQAADRQEYICQSQSLNLMIHPNTPTKDINALYLKANELGIKSLYYQFSINASQEFNKKLLSCSVCES